MTGTLALVGGGEWQDGCSFDADLLAASGGDEVLVLPTAAAYEHPDRAVERATTWFDGLGARVTGLPVLRRSEGTADDVVAAVRGARFIYLADGSPLHLRSVLKESPVWDALVAAWQDGAVVAGSGAGAMVLGDPMVDPRGGAFTVGLGLVEWLAVVPHHESWSPEQAKRSIDLAETGLPLVGIDTGTALLRSPEGTWSVAGQGSVTVIIDGTEGDISTLPS